MKVFISWSGDRSRAVAELLANWLKCVLQATDPWISSSNIDNGTVWFTEITKTLSEVQIGIFCITPENREKPWILFEAGAISSKLSEGRVITLILGEQTKNDILPPLSQFHAAYPEKLEMLRVVSTINKLLNSPLPIQILESVFEKYWGDFESEYKIIINKKPESIPDHREKGDILNEILSTVRGFDQRIRNIEASKITSDQFYKLETDISKIYKTNENMQTIKDFEDIFREFFELKHLYPHDNLNQIKSKVLLEYQSKGLSNSYYKNLIERAFEHINDKNQTQTLSS